METLIVVPARYGSSRYPGKPLAEIAGRSMVSRVARRALAAANQIGDAKTVVATDDQRIIDHCAQHDMDAVLTSPDLPSGSDRALAAAQALRVKPKFVVNLQGDAPFTPIDYLVKVIERLRENTADVATPVVQLDWQSLDAMRSAKRDSPFSGTTVILGPNNRALWFSKNIIPAIRDETNQRQQTTLSPVRRHVGLYGFRFETLEWFVSAKESPYEKTEGLEQLRLLESGRSIACVEVAAPPLSIGGIDTPQDLARVEALIESDGDPDLEFFAT
ncbi:MAG: 3-deoxy-manno-octulosonate cytidylyltransferase [Pseudomonadota bacterium]